MYKYYDKDKEVMLVEIDKEKDTLFYGIIDSISQIGQTEEVAEDYKRYGEHIDRTLRKYLSEVFSNHFRKIYPCGDCFVFATEQTNKKDVNRILKEESLECEEITQKEVIDEIKKFDSMADLKRYIMFMSAPEADPRIRLNAEEYPKGKFSREAADLLFKEDIERAGREHLAVKKIEKKEYLFFTELFGTFVDLPVSVSGQIYQIRNGYVLKTDSPMFELLEEYSGVLPRKAPEFTLKKGELKKYQGKKA